jgi:hypothetical protein
MTSVRNLLAAMWRGLSGASVSHRVAVAKTAENEFELIGLVYLLNLFAAFIAILALSAAIGRHDPSQRLLSVTNAALPFACANVLAFFATYFASLNWTRGEEVRRKVRSRWLLIPAIAGMGVFSVGLTVGLFFVFGFGTALAGFAANVMLLQGLFAIRTSWA